MSVCTRVQAGEFTATKTRKKNEKTNGRIVGSTNSATGNGDPGDCSFTLRLLSRAFALFQSCAAEPGGVADAARLPGKGEDSKVELTPEQLRQKEL